MSASLSGVFNCQEFTDLGLLGAGMRLYTYEPATTTQKVAYTDPAGTIPHAYTADGLGGQYLALNSRGELPAPLFLASGGYDLTLKTSGGVTVWTRRAIGGSDSSEQLRTDLANTSDATKGAGMSGFDWALVYAANTSGWGIRSAANSHNVLRWITPNLWAAILNGTSTTDVSTQMQTALDFIYANGGGELFVPGKLLCNTPLLVKDGVSIRGMGSAISRIVKDSTTTKAVTVTAGALAVYGGAVLPANINAVLVLDGPSGRYRGRISDIGIESTLATPGNFETQKAEFGIVSLGSVSDSTFEGVRVLQCQYSIILPVAFAIEVRRCKFESCLRGFAVDNGTSLTYCSNYANNCRDWGHYLRDMKYSEITANACDFLNDPAKYPTRTRLCNAYRLEALLSCEVTCNGDENTWGRSYYFDAFDHSTFESNVSIDIGSNYTGAAEIAWIYSTDIMRGSKVRKNLAYGVKSGGLTYGGASPAKHHNIYFEGQANVEQIDFDGNVVRASRFGAIVEAGWGNNIPTTWPNAARGGGLIYTHSPTLQAQVMGDLAVTYGADNRHFIEQRGSLLHVWGCFHATPTHTTASGLLVINGFPTVGARSAAVEVSGVGGGSGLASKLGWFEFAAAATGGVGRTDGDGNFTIADLPTGTTVRIFYDGWYSTV